MNKKTNRIISIRDLVLRVTVSDDGAAEIEVNPEKWKDPDVWGTLLADVANTIAGAYAKELEREKFLGTLETSFSRDLKECQQAGGCNGEKPCS
jgi:hypothetical protein